MVEDTTFFIVGNTYIFLGEEYLIENKKRTDKILGKFIKYLDIFYWGDLLLNAKAEFEFGTLNSGYYSKIKKYSPLN
jgi:hypothetical protein